MTNYPDVLCNQDNVLERVTMKPEIAIFGIGHMGSAVARRLADHGYTLYLWNRTSERLHNFNDPPYHVTHSPDEAGRQAKVWITFLADGPSTLELWKRNDGLHKAAESFQTDENPVYWLQMATLDYRSTLQLASAARLKKIHFLDIPVLGSTGEALRGELILMPGGDADDIEAVREILSIMGKTIVHCGPVGTGTLMKLTTNLLLSHMMVGLSEWFTLGSQVGLNPHDMFRVIRDSKLFSPMFAGKFPKMINDDFTPSFPLRWMRKDLNNILETAHHVGACLPVAAIMKALYDAADNQALGDLDYSAVVRILKQLSRGMPHPGPLHHDAEEKP